MGEMESSAAYFSFAKSTEPQLTPTRIAQPARRRCPPDNAPFLSGHATLVMIKMPWVIAGCPTCGAYDLRPDDVLLQVHDQIHGCLPTDFDQRVRVFSAVNVREPRPPRPPAVAQYPTVAHVDVQAFFVAVWIAPRPGFRRQSWRNQSGRLAWIPRQLNWGFRPLFFLQWIN